MEVFHKNLIINGYIPEQDGLKLASFSYTGISQDDYGYGGATDTVYLGNARRSTLTNMRYQTKLTPSITLVDLTHRPIEIETLRHVMQRITGTDTWMWMVMFDEMYHETLYYRCVVTSVACQRVAGKIVGIIITFECDSPYAYTKEFEITGTIEAANESLTLMNTTDEVNMYIYPKLTMTFSKAADSIQVINENENNYTTEIDNISSGEIITMDGNYSICDTNLDRYILDDFNFHYVRFVPGKNVLTFSQPCDIDLRWRALRKVGI